MKAVVTPALLWSVIATWTVPVSAQVTFDRVFPPAVSIGDTATLTAEGKFADWPVTIVHDRDDIEITADKESGKLSVRVPESASAGVTWVQLADAKSASGWVPIVVTPAGVIEETEPNERIEDTQPVTLPAVIAGRLAKRGDSDAYRIDLESGQTLVASVTANALLGAPMDAVLQLTDTDGNVLAQSDDARGLDPQIVYQATDDCQCVLRVFAFPETPNSTIGFAGGSDFVYLIETTTGPFLDHVAVGRSDVSAIGYNLGSPDQGSPAGVVVSEPTRVSPAVATLPGALGWDWVRTERGEAVTRNQRSEFDGAIPTLIAGHIQSPEDRHGYVFQATKGTRYRAEIRSKVYGYPLDSQLVIVDPESGDELASNDDVTRGGYDAGVEFTAKADGPVEVRVSDLVGGFGTRHFYELLITPVMPGFEVTVASPHFAVARDKPIEIPVSIARSGGFDGQLRVSAVGLPDGVAADAVISKAKGDTSKSVKLKLDAADATVGRASFRIVAEVVGESGEAVGKADEAVPNQTAATYALRPSVPLSEFTLTVSQAGKE